MSTTETEDGKNIFVDPVERNKGHEFPESISVIVIDDSENLSIEEYLKGRWEAESLYFKYEPVLIDNIESQRVQNIPGVIGADDIFTKREDRIYNINLFKRNEEISGTFNQILSTFKFTD